MRRQLERPIHRLGAARDIPPDTFHGFTGGQAKDGQNKGDTDHLLPRLLLRVRVSERPLKRLAGCRDVAAHALHSLAGGKPKNGKDQSDTDHGTPRCLSLRDKRAPARAGGKSQQLALRAIAQII